MKTSFALTLLLSLVVVFPVRSQQPAAARTTDDGSHKVMQHWVGDWSGGVAGASNVTVQHIAHVPDHAKVAWMLDEHFLHGTNMDKEGKSVGVWLMRYRPSSKKYQVWFFTSQGEVSVWNGTWNESAQTMAWETRDAETGVTGSGQTRFVDGRQEWTMSVTKDRKTEKSSGSLTRK